MARFGEGSADGVIDDARAKALLDGWMGDWARERGGWPSRVLLIPPDHTRLHSGAGPLTTHLARAFREGGSAEVAVLPALGTHYAMTSAERAEMFPGLEEGLFREHHWRDRVESVGEIGAEEMGELSEGRVRSSARVEVNRELLGGGWNLIVSIGQLVPHEVIGIANQVKNILVGVGGRDLINKSHWLGAVHGMERVMGRSWSPVRELLTRAFDRFLGGLPVTYVLTVRARGPEGGMVTRGLFAGSDRGTYLAGAELCRATNLDFVDRPIRKAVVRLDPAEFKSTWLGNKAIYRLRMAMADGGQLVIHAPGVSAFGEKPEIDALIRRHGYRGTAATLEAVERDAELREELSAAAHLIHGSTESRFEVVYATGGLTRAEVEGAGYRYARPEDVARACGMDRLKEGWNATAGGEEVFYVSNPALGLWTTRERFEESGSGN